MKLRLPLIFMMAILAACSESNQNQAALNLHDTNGVVYGEDSMQNAEDKTDLLQDANYEINRSASVALFPKARLKKTDQGYEFPDATVSKFYGTCADYKYSDKVNPASCSGTLIAPNLVLTAAHCMNTTKDSCGDTAFAFGFESSTTVLKTENVYTCKKIYAMSFFEHNTYNDYAIVELDRAVEGINPVRISSSALTIGQEIYTLGYSLGTSKKYSDGKVRRFEKNDLISTTLDENFGNSGGPIYDRTTHELVGIVNGGEEDFEQNEAAGCMEPKICKEDECMGEIMMPISVILNNLKEKGLSL